MVWSLSEEKDELADERGKTSADIRRKVRSCVLNILPFIHIVRYRVAKPSRQLDMSLRRGPGQRLYLGVISIDKAKNEVKMSREETQCKD